MSPRDGSGTQSLPVSPAVALDCSELVGGESHQNRGTQNSALWPSKCLSYKAWSR